MALMRHLVEVLQALQHPWIDPRVFNMEPDELYSGSWCQRLRPLLAVPNQAAQEQGGEWRLLSFSGCIPHWLETLLSGAVGRGSYEGAIGLLVSGLVADSVELCSWSGPCGE